MIKNKLYPHEFEHKRGKAIPTRPIVELDYAGLSHDARKVDHIPCIVNRSEIIVENWHDFWTSAIHILYCNVSHKKRVRK